MLNEESRMNCIVDYAVMVLWCMCHEQNLNGISHIVLVQAKYISDYGLTIHTKTVEMQSFSHVPYQSSLAALVRHSQASD